MSSSRLVRGAKTRMFAIVCLICVLGAVVFVFHGTQSKLAEVQKLMNSCNQQQESLSAQLQVIFEYKVRLEKSLTKEKEDHKKTKDTLEAKLKEEKEGRERDNQEAKNKYEALSQQNKYLQNQLYELKDNEEKDLTKLRDEIQDLHKEIDRLKKENQDQTQKCHDIEDLKAEYLKKKDEIRALREENDGLKTRIMPENEQKLFCEKEKKQIKEDLERTKKVLEQCEDSNRADMKPKQESPNTNVGEMPKMIYQGSKAPNGSTTPGLNPDAVNNFDVSSPRPIKEVEPPVAKPPSNDQGSQVPKKPTQESVAPLALPKEQEDSVRGRGVGGGVAGLHDQIPVPGDLAGAAGVGQSARGGGRAEARGSAKDPAGNTLHKPNTGGGGQAEESAPVFLGAVGDGLDADQPKLHIPAPIDEDDNFQKQQGEIPRVKNPDHYPHGGDYEREQPDDEEDDEGEQMEYDEHKRDQKNIGHNMVLRNPPAPVHDDDRGVMAQPK